MPWVSLEPGSEEAGCAQTGAGGRSAEAAGGRQSRAVTPASLCPSVCCLRPSGTQEQEENGAAGSHPLTMPAEGGLRGQLVADCQGLACKLRAARDLKLHGTAWRGAIVYVFLESQTDPGLVFAGRAQSWCVRVAAAATASAVSAACARSRDR